MKTRGFDPKEIIFSATTACNLHCQHCFVNRNPLQLDIGQAVAFLRECAASGKIERVGFSGGEPFLYMEFLLALTKETVALDLLFDQIMTNGDWWKDEADLRDRLQTLYDAGYDGKIGLSWDEYHGQTKERMLTFIKTVKEIFGKDSINIQTVETSGALRQAQGPQNQKTAGVPEPGEGPLKDISVYTLPRTYPSTDPLAWKDRRWFREDYCQGPGNILYVHADGNIAPCCGFANENSALFIGTINDNFETILKNAQNNKLVQICFQEGLSHYRRHGLKKILHAGGKKLPGRTCSICTFCDYICRL